MTETLFLAGGSGVVGMRLIPLLVADRWRVFATTRTPDKAPSLRALGAEPVIVDVYDAEGLASAMAAAAPSVVVHQLTSLPDNLDPERMPAARVANSRIRDEGTRNLIAAALCGSVGRLVVQSIGFAYAPGVRPYVETDPIDAQAHGVLSLESQALAAPFEALVLRYGHFYGPDTGFAQAHSLGSLHVEDAAEAARVAVRRGAPGVYNIAEDDGALSVEKAARELGFRARRA